MWKINATDTMDTAIKALAVINIIIKNQLLAIDRKDFG